MRVREYLKALHEGKTISLEDRENQAGDLVSVDCLFFEKGQWQRARLNCWNSQDMGFGTCRCQSHPAFPADGISRKEVLSHLQALARRDTEDKAARAAETAWLETAIANCPS